MNIHPTIGFLLLSAAMLATAAETTPTTRRDIRQDRKSTVRPTRWVNPLRSTIEGAEHKTFHSASMKCEVGFVVYTPPGYAADTKRYPVIYWLHGRGANESSGVVAIQALHDLIVAKKVPPMMMVCPNGGDSSFYCDSPDGTVMAETAFIRELIPVVDKNYRTIASRGGRALEGFSMGGFGVMKLGAKYPELFCSLQTYGGALVDERTMPVRHSGTFTLMFGGKVELFRESDPRVWMKKHADELRRSVKIRQVVGTKDPTRMENEPFDELLTQSQIPHEVESVPDIGHNPRLYYQQVGEKGFLFHARAFAAAEKSISQEDESLQPAKPRVPQERDGPHVRWPAGADLERRAGLETHRPDSARFQRTRIIGYSQVGQPRGGWFVAGGVFESIAGDDRWELLWNGGAGVDKWRESDYAGWSRPLVSACLGDAPVDRVVLSVSGPYGSDEKAWAEAIEATVKTIRGKIPTVRQIVLQAVVGGPDGKVCPAPAGGRGPRGKTGGGEVRASAQHPHIVNAIRAVVEKHAGAAMHIVAGFEPKVRACKDYADALGHLTPAAAAAVARAIGEHFKACDANPQPTRTR